MCRPAGLSPTEIPLGLLRPLCLKASFCAGHRAVSAAPPSLGLLQPAWPRLGAVPPPVQTPVSPSRGFLVASNAWHRPHSHFNVLNQIRYSQVTFTRTHLARSEVAQKITALFWFCFTLKEISRKALLCSNFPIPSFLRCFVTHPSLHGKGGEICLPTQQRACPRAQVSGEGSFAFDAVTASALTVCYYSDCIICKALSGQSITAKC